jgi:predicted membrane-bound spermidine synthase
MPLLVRLLFGLSGLCGLVYESVWAGYLKLLGGHASYGQILSLCVFMGGLALGSHLSGRFMERLRHPWRVYAAVEIAIGVGALVYHDLFAATSEWLWTSGVLEGRGVWAARGLLALGGTVLTLPWAVCLGATFPLVAAGFLRKRPQDGTRLLGILYFANSLGGALGSLLNSFVLVPRLGLPGSLAVAGSANFVVGLGFLAMSLRSSDPEPSPRASSPVPRAVVPMAFLFCACAFFTGFSSFCYEISWMRMLALQLGSSTHSFDIMLSAFLTGLALGGFVVRKMLGDGRERLFLARVQLAMALCAAASILGYQAFFLARNELNLVLRTSDEAYPFLQLFKFASAFLMMGPAAFCAGMTLPLLTSWIVRDSGREEGLGGIYAWNTLGSLLGALLGGLVAMPLLGLQGVLVAGAAIDAALGLWLLGTWRPRRREGALALVTLAVLFLAALMPLRSDIVTQGAFRAFTPHRDGQVFRMDGRASTVSVHIRPGGYAVLRNNGKPDASLSLVGEPGKGDNKTQGTLAWAPFSTRHRPYRAVLIGLGSGMTAHYLLGDPLLESLDVVEIEPAVFEMSKHFRVRNHRIFEDPRLHFWAEDARSFFATHGGRWDLIVSEPSNPWVSGTSSLFTREFYRNVTRHLTSDGVLAQWLQSYEFRDELFLSILKAMRESFPQVALHPIPGTTADVLLLAGREKPVPDPRRLSFGVPYADICAEGLRPDQVAVSEEVSSRELDILLEGIRPNSDYAPVVDVGAEEAFFTKSRVTFPMLLAPRPTGYFRAADPWRYGQIREAWERRWLDLTDTACLRAAEALCRAHARSGEPVTARELEFLDSLVGPQAWPGWIAASPALPMMRRSVALSPGLSDSARARFLLSWYAATDALDSAVAPALYLAPRIRRDGRLYAQVFGTLWSAGRVRELDAMRRDTSSWIPLSWPEKLFVANLREASRRRFAGEY